MGLFGKKNKDEDVEEIENDLEGEKRELREGLRFKRKLKDLNPENKGKRAIPPKPWGKKERIIVLTVFLITVLGSGFLSLSSRGFKLPNLPKITFPNINISDLNFLKSKTYIIGERKNPNNPKNQEIINLFSDTVKSYSGIYAFYVYDLSKENSFGYEENTKMQAASLMKLPVIYAFYMEVKKGNQKMDMEAREQIRLMGQKSDNKSFSLMRQRLGDGLIQKYIDDLGLENTNLKDNTTTPREISVFFQEIWKFDDKERNEILSYLTDTIYEDYLPKGVTGGIKVAHKYGRENHVINDAGIILTNTPFIMVIMSQGIVDRDAMELIPKLSKLVFNKYTM